MLSIYCNIPNSNFCIKQQESIKMRTSRKPSINQYLRPKSGRLKSEKSVRINSVTEPVKKIEEHLRHQIEKTQKVLQQITNTISTQKHQQIIATEVLDQYRKIEQEIRRKDIQIKQTQKFIKQLQNGHSDQEKPESIESIVHHEIKVKLDQIKKLKSILIEKNEKILHKKQKIKILIQQSRRKSIQSKFQVVSFQQFKQKYFKRSKEMRKNSEYDKFSINQSQSKKRVASNREKKQGLKQKQAEYQLSGENRKIKDILIRKNVTSMALKTAKKKHLLEMSNYRSKLQFLRDQNEQLQNKLVSKMQELKIAQSKFCQTRTKSNSKNSIACRRFKTHVE